MLRFKNRKLQERGLIAFDDPTPEPGSDPSGTPAPSSPSAGADPAAAARRVGDKTSARKEIQELKDGMAKIMAILESKGKPEPVKDDKKKTEPDQDSSQLKATLDALQVRLVQLEGNLQKSDAENARLMQESLRTRFMDALVHPKMETPTKEALRKFLFSDLESRLAFDPANPGEVQVRFKDPTTGRIDPKAFQQVVDQERKCMRNVTLVEFLNEELPKPDYQDFWAVPGTQDPGFIDAVTPPRERKGKVTPEQQHDKTLTQERGDPAAIGRRLGRARETATAKP